MAFTDAFTGTTGQRLPDYSANWTYYGPLLDPLLNAYTIQSNTAAIGSFQGYLTAVLHSVGSPDHYAEAKFLDTASGLKPPLVVRATDGGSWFGLGTYVDALTLVVSVNGNVTTLWTGAANSYVPGATYRVTVVGTAYEVKQNGVVIKTLSYSDPAIDSGARAGFAANYGNAVQHFDDFACDILGIGAISLSNEPAANRVYLLNKAGFVGRTLTFIGTYAGDVSAIEFQLVEYDSGNIVSGFDWQDLPAGSTFSGGNFGFAVQIPAGPWYRLKLRAKNHPTDVTISTQSRWGVGLTVLEDGQSNMAAWETTATTTASTLVAKYDVTASAWTRQGIGSASNLFCDALATALNMVVGYVNVAVGSTDIDPHVNAGYWTAMIAAITAMNGGTADVGLVVWKQGESDTQSGQNGNTTNYVALLTAYITNLRTACSRAPSQLPMIVCPIGRNMGASDADAAWTAIREGHYRVGNVYPGVSGPSNCFIGGDAIALPHPAGNGLHEDLTGNQESAARAARSYLKAKGLAANDGQGPIPLYAVIFGNLIWVGFNLNGASALAQTAAGNLVGWVVRDGTGTVVAGTTATLVGNQVRIALPGSPPAGPYTVAHLGGEDPLGGAADATTVALVRGNVQLRSGGLYTEAAATRKRLPVSTGVLLTSVDVASSTTLDAQAIVPLIRLTTPNIAGDIMVDGKAIVPIAYLQTASVAAVSAVDAQDVVPVMPLSFVDVASSISVDATAIKVGNYAYTPGNQRRVLVAPDSSPYIGEQLAPPLPTFFKDPASTLDFSFDWATLGWLNEGERIVAVDWDMPSALHSVFTTGEDGLCANWFAGGIVGETYTVQLTVRTNIGRIDNRAMLIEVVDR